MKKFFICSTSACVERMLDCEKIYAFLMKNNWQPVRKVSKADLVIISTCSFGEYEDDCSIRLIKHYSKKKAKSAQMIIAGCLPIINSEKLKGLDDFLTLSPTNLNKLDKIMKAEIAFDDVGEPNRIFATDVSYKPSLKKILDAKTILLNFFNHFELRKNFLEKQTNLLRKITNYTVLLKSYIHPLLVGIRGDLFYLRISKGCFGSCSYCAKRFATGTLKSKSPEAVIKEFKKGLDLGHKKFFLLTEDAGCYGLDIGTTINQLLKEIFRVGERHDYKLIISNFNAHWFLRYYAELENILLNNQDKILYMHIPIQSASNRILRLMNRPYKIEDIERSLCNFKEKASALSFTTDMMVGFPGETEEDFNLSKEFLKKIRFQYADIFGYENRPNTPASRMEHKVPQDVIERRTFELLKIQNHNSKTSTIFKKMAEVVRDFV